jgi:hypothetical protein
MPEFRYPIKMIRGVPVVTAPEEIDSTKPTGCAPPCSDQPHMGTPRSWRT